MFEEHKHQLAIDLIRAEACRIGGEIFTVDFIKMIAEARAKDGTEETKRYLNMVAFIEKLLAGGSLSEEREIRFHKLIASLTILCQDT